MEFSFPDWSSSAREFLRCWRLLLQRLLQSAKSADAPVASSSRNRRIPHPVPRSANYKKCDAWGSPQCQHVPATRLDRQGGAPGNGDKITPTTEKKMFYVNII